MWRCQPGQHLTLDYITAGELMGPTQGIAWRPSANDRTNARSLYALLTGRVSSVGGADAIRSTGPGAQRLAAAKAELATLLQRGFKPEHPQVRDLQRLILELTKDAEAEALRLRSAASFAIRLIAPRWHGLQTDCLHRVRDSRRFQSVAGSDARQRHRERGAASVA